jgi:hypothetical protein
LLKDDRFKDIDTSIATIDRIEFSKKCNKNHIIRTAIIIVSRLFSKDINLTKQPQIKLFSLSDASARKCIDNGSSISLSCLSIALYGKTWYEKHFSAKIYNDYERDRYSNDLQKLVSNDKLDWIYISRRFQISDECRKIYEDSQTYREFFIELKKTMDKIKYCEFLASWLESFINEIIFCNTNYFSMQWIINPKDISPVNFIDGNYMQQIKDKPLYENIVDGSKFLDSSSKLKIIM